MRLRGTSGFEALGRSGPLGYIWGRRCYNLTGRGFAALAGMRELRAGVSCRNVETGDYRGCRGLGRSRSLCRWMFRTQVPACGKVRRAGDAALHVLSGDDGRGYRAYRGDGAEIVSELGDADYGWESGDAGRDEIAGTFARCYSCAGITDAGLARVADLPRLRDVDLEKLPNVTREGAGIFPGHVRGELFGSNAEMITIISAWRDAPGPREGQKSTLSS